MAESKGKKMNKSPKMKHMDEKEDKKLMSKVMKKKVKKDCMK